MIEEILGMYEREIFRINFSSAVGLFFMKIEVNGSESVQLEDGKSRKSERETPKQSEN